MLARRLSPGDKLGIVAPSSPVTAETEAQLEKGIAFLEELGFEVLVGRHVRSTTLGYCAAPEEKAADIDEMFADTSVTGIICAQGGATANACLPHLAWPTIASHPKVVMGMSDNTVLLNAIHAVTGLVTFHGTDLMWGFGRAPSEYDREGFIRTLVEGLPGPIPANGERRTIRTGSCQGTALGGNLRCLLKLSGTRFFPAADGAVLFLEAVDVSPEECDHLVQQLEQMDVFDRIRGVVVGHIDGLQGDPGAVQMEDVLARASAEHRFPILKTDDFGHNCPNAVVPIGAKVRVDADRQTIELLGPFIA